MDYLFILAVNITVAILGLLFGNYVRKHPEYFWRYLLIGCLATSPLAIGGLTWYEELFTGFYLLANLPIKLLKLSKLHYLIFVFFILYMVFQSFRGIIEFGSLVGIEGAIRKIRWPIFFLILLGLFFKTNNSKIRNLTDKDLAYNIVVFGLIFHIIYILWGVIALIKGGSEVYTQNAMINYADVYGYAPSMFLAIWTPTAYVSSILTIVIPAVIMILTNPLRRRRAIAWITLYVLAITEFLYDSRSGSLCLFALVLISFSKLGIRKIAVISILSVVLLLTAIFISNIRRGKSVDYYLSDIKRTVMPEKDDNYDKELQDIDRKIWMYSAIPALTVNPVNFLFGYGFRMSGYVVAPYVHEMFSFYGRAKEYREDVGTEAITNIAVDSGIIGLILVGLLFISAGRSLYKQGSDYRIILIASLGLMFCWLFIINIVDLFLLYLMIMPSGILTQLGKVSLASAYRET